MSVKASKHELIRLIHTHLMESGFHSAAQELRKQNAQKLGNASVSLMEIYSSWLNDSRKNTDSVKHGTSPAKATKINTPSTSAGASSSDTEDLSQSLLPQTPCLTSKKPGHSSPVKPVAASPFKRKLDSTFTHVPVAPDESSDSTDISGNEKNAPSVTASPQVKSPRKKHNSTSATSPAQISVSNDDASPNKPKKKKKQHSEKAMKRKQKVKRKKRDGKTDKGIKVKVPKTPGKGKKVSCLPTTAAGDKGSDSDSSLDVEKWRKLLLDMTEADIIKMNIINALDSSASPQKKRRVRKPPIKPPPKRDAPAEQNNGTVENNVKVDDSIVKGTPSKTTKPRKNRTKASGSVAASPKLNENLVTADGESGVSPTKQVTKKDKRKSVAFGEENGEEVQSEPKGKKRKTHMAEDEMKENAKEATEDQREEIIQQSLVSEPVKEKKKKMKNKPEDGSIMENTSETVVNQEYPEHTRKKKKKQTTGEKVGKNVTETAEDQREEVDQHILVSVPVVNQEYPELVKKKKKKQKAGENVGESTTENAEGQRERGYMEQNQEVSQQSLVSMPTKEKKKKMKHKPEDETATESANETTVSLEYPEQMRKKMRDIKDNAEQAVKIKKSKKKKMEREEGDENSEQVINDHEDHTEVKTVEEKTKKKRKKSDHKDAS